MYGGSIDWHRATTTQRQAVHAAARRINVATNMSWSEFFQATLGQVISGQADIEHTVTNFRHGTLARRSVAKIYNWIEDNHPDEASRLDLELMRAQKAPLHDVLISDLSAEEIDARLASRGKTLNTPVTIADSIFLITGRHPTVRHSIRRRKERLRHYLSEPLNNLPSS